MADFVELNQINRNKLLENYFEDAFSSKFQHFVPPFQLWRDFLPELTQFRGNGWAFKMLHEQFCWDNKIPLVKRNLFENLLRENSLRSILCSSTHTSMFYSRIVTCIVYAGTFTCDLKAFEKNIGSYSIPSWYSFYNLIWFWKCKTFVFLSKKLFWSF